MFSDNKVISFENRFCMLEFLIIIEMSFIGVSFENKRADALFFASNALVLIQKHKVFTRTVNFHN